jgi:DNA-binding response OmpR family regulator
MARILLIDDDDSVRKALGLALVCSGHTVIEARDGEEGLELFARTSVDLVITDMVMPRKGGLEVIRALREKQPQMRIIAMSGGSELGGEDILHVARREGAAEVLTKPFASTVLLAMIEGVLLAGASEPV